jgi:hypothetical protein
MAEEATQPQARIDNDPAARVQQELRARLSAMTAAELVDLCSQLL